VISNELRGETLHLESCVSQIILRPKIAELTAPTAIGSAVGNCTTNCGGCFWLSITEI